MQILLCEFKFKYLPYALFFLCFHCFSSIFFPYTLYCPDSALAVKIKVFYLLPFSRQPQADISSNPHGLYIAHTMHIKLPRATYRYFLDRRHTWVLRVVWWIQNAMFCANFTLQSKNAENCGQIGRNEADGVHWYAE